MKANRPQFKVQKILKNHLKEVVVIFSAIPITLILGSIGLFRGLETPVLDFLTRVQGGQHRNVVIVRITDNDYQNYFSGKSPLDQKVLGKVISAIAKGGRRLSASTLTLQDRSFGNLKQTKRGLQSFGRVAQPIQTVTSAINSLTCWATRILHL